MRNRWTLVAGVGIVAMLVVGGPFAVASAQPGSAESISVGTEVQGDSDRTITAQRWDAVTVTVWANATNVAGYQSALTYDPTVLQVTDTSGTTDYDAPVANVDNSNGSVTFNQIRAGEATNPLLAEITLEVIGTGGQQSDLSFVSSETKFSNATGDTFTAGSSSGLTVAVQSRSSSATQAGNSGQSGPGFGAPAVLLVVGSLVGWVMLRERTAQ